MKPLIAVIDYGMGNLHSVHKALERAGGRVCVTDSARRVREAGAVVLPGVGAFGEAVRRLGARRLLGALDDALSQGKPFLGICLGLQLLFERSEESRGAKGLGFFKGPVVRFASAPRLKVPHIGWNTLSLESVRRVPCLRGIRGSDYFYFVHSYYPVPEDRECRAASTRYGTSFCSAAARGPVFASQFHPEKSGALGLRLLKNFVNEAERC